MVYGFSGVLLQWSSDTFLWCPPNSTAELGLFFYPGLTLIVQQPEAKPCWDSYPYYTHHL